MGITILDDVRAIPGWLTDPEGELLCKAAMEVCDRHIRGAWVEIGSYCGKSTVLLGLTLSLLCHPEFLYAIDPHEGDLSFPSAFDAEGRKVPHSIAKTAPSLDVFLKNIKDFELTAYIHPLVARSTDVAWDKPIALIFIDGLHDYQSVRADYEHFKPYLIPNATIIFHDDDWAGVHQFITERIEAGELIKVDQADSLVITRLQVHKS